MSKYSGSRLKGAIVGVFNIRGVLIGCVGICLFIDTGACTGASMDLTGDLPKPVATSVTRNSFVKL